MSGTKLSALTELTTLADDDEFVVVDKSDTTMAASGTDKRVTKATVVESITGADNIFTGENEFTEGVLFSDGGLSVQGALENPVLLHGYNQEPYYHLADPSEPGLSWVIEPNYIQTPAVAEWMEAYVQYLPDDDTEVGTRRPFMTQISRLTGEISETLIHGGSSVSLNFTPDSGTTAEMQAGVKVLTVNGRNSAIFGQHSDDKFTLSIDGDNDAGDIGVLSFVDKNSGQHFDITARATALGMAMRFVFGSSERLRLDNDGALHVLNNVGFYGTTPIAKQTGVAVSAAGVHAALVNLGLIAA